MFIFFFVQVLKSSDVGVTSDNTVRWWAWEGEVACGRLVFFFFGGGAFNFRI